MFGCKRVLPVAQGQAFYTIDVVDHGQHHSADGVFDGLIDYENTVAADSGALQIVAVHAPKKGGRPVLDTPLIAVEATFGPIDRWGAETNGVNP